MDLDTYRHYTARSVRCRCGPPSSSASAGSTAIRARASAAQLRARVARNVATILEADHQAGRRQGGNHHPRRRPGRVHRRLAVGLDQVPEVCVVVCHGGEGSEARYGGPVATRDPQAIKKYAWKGIELTGAHKESELQSQEIVRELQTGSTQNLSTAEGCE